MLWSKKAIWLPVLVISTISKTVLLSDREHPIKINCGNEQNDVSKVYKLDKESFICQRK